MKTLGRITGTLALLLALYVFSYWLFYTKGWLYSSLSASVAGNAVHKVFEPLAQLDDFLNVEVPVRKFLTGHWKSDTTGDFVTFGPDQECRFQLGKFAFEGKAEYDNLAQCFVLEFRHQDRAHTLILRHVLFIDTFRSDILVPVKDGQAFATIEHSPNEVLPPIPDYETILTKQAPNAPVP